jgi:ATP-dependent DNA helicase RecG
MPATKLQVPDARADAAGRDESGDPGGRALPCAFASPRALSRAELSGSTLRWPSPSRLAAPVEAPGKRAAAGLRTLGIETVGELLEHLPSDSREARTVAALAPGEQATVAVEVRTIAARKVRRRGMRPLVEALVFDASATMRATFFNQPWLVQRYPPGTRLLLHGKADGRGGFRVSHHAVRGATQSQAGDCGSGAVAHYPAAEGISSTQILTLVQEARRALADVPEPLGAALRSGERLPDRASALAAMHFAREPWEAESGRRRLAFDELLLAQLALALRRARRSARADAVALTEPGALSERWLAQLPFEPTASQREAIGEIAADLRRGRPMQRLLMGEVGSGKTVVALFAMLRAVEHGHQAALMAPTETLAEQHFATVQRLMGAEPLRAALLTGSTPARRRREIVARLASGELSLVIGTHALIEPDVVFGSLAVAVVDEQHRFGVHQRAALEDKHADHPPHTLHMTATPIPRTLALARYGDLDRTCLRELPSGRRATDTRVLSGEGQRRRAYGELREQLRHGRQAFVVCPLIEEDDEDLQRLAGAQASRGARRAATAELERLREGELRGYELGLLHGAMAARAKQQAMAAFAAGDTQVLVATTVIEVGIDVPNATVMLIENPERFGISQLHQLRGRVGRGEHAAVCYLLAGEGHERSPRLRALAEHADGFRLAEIDLELRNEGELIGTRQAGLREFAVARLPQDVDLLERARAHARSILARDPELEAPEHALLGAALVQRFGERARSPIPA